MVPELSVRVGFLIKPSYRRWRGHKHARVGKFFLTYCRIPLSSTYRFSAQGAQIIAKNLYHVIVVFYDSACNYHFSRSHIEKYFTMFLVYRQVLCTRHLLLPFENDLVLSGRNRERRPGKDVLEHISTIEGWKQVFLRQSAELRLSNNSTTVD